ncbi:DUF3558 domain-containing protein [Pseudonocardia sp. TRM90224]|uniref:DUF3558 domain-containing protein n=1 Tax=Pseudonocardia sp. TRM90224 TaxID=2812678 RepID=UPI001E459645|nr:DUF3558 domain-containing protein [Pseudonocardia sp. TRM90224]
MGRRAAALVALLLAVALVGCASEPAPDAAPPTRDPQAVTSALIGLDPCAPIRMQQLAAGETVRQTGPNRCWLNTQGKGVSVQVVLGQWRHIESLGTETQLVIGGAKAYQAVSANRLSCRVSIPVSPKLAVAVQTSVDAPSSDDLCGRTLPIATSAVAVLNGEQAPPEPPALTWNSCDLLGRAVGAAADGLPRRYDPANFGLDKCAAVREMPEGYQQVFGLSVTFKDPADLLGTQDTLVAGLRAKQQDFGTDCNVEWTAGTSGIAEPDLAGAVLLLNAPNCADAVRYADAATAAFAMAPPPGVTPLRPLTYRPDERDNP